MSTIITLVGSFFAKLFSKKREVSLVTFFSKKVTQKSVNSFLACYSVNEYLGLGRVHKNLAASKRSVITTTAPITDDQNSPKKPLSNAQESAPVIAAQA